MPDLSPFLSRPGEWIEELAELKRQKAKIEDREEHLRNKLKLHMAEKGLESIAGDKHVARLETREGVNWSKKALASILSAEVINECEARLPKKSTTALVVRERKDDVAKERIGEIETFFDNRPIKPSEFFDKRKEAQ